jgi:Putative Actinobacterial Holin-X, holin superfamily III
MNSVTASNPADGTPRRTEETPVDERPIGAIVTDLWLNTETLIRQELQLGLADATERAQAFKTELSADVAVLKRELLMKAIGGAVAFVGVLSLTAALVLLVATELPAWLSALIVGLVISGGAGVLLARTMRTPELPNTRELVPKRAAQSVKDDVQTIQEAMK